MTAVYKNNINISVSDNYRYLKRTAAARRRATSKKLYSLLIAGFFSFDLLKIFWLNEYDALLSYIGFFAVAVAFAIAFLSKPLIIKGREAFIIALLIVSLPVSSLINGNIKITEVVWYFKYIFSVYILLKRPLWSKPFIITFLIFAVYLLICILKGTSVLEITQGVSQNAIALYLLPLLCICYISTLDKKYNNKLLLIFVSIYMIIALWTGSRSALLTAIILLLCAIFTDRGKICKHIFMRLFVIACLSAIVIIALNFKGVLQEYLSAISQRTIRNINDEPRYHIITEYINACKGDPKYLLFGARLSDIKLINFYSGNPHSMFIRLHANFGLIPFVVIVWYIIVALYRFIKFNKSYFFIFVAIIIRGATDSIGFTGLFDIFTLYFIFYSFTLTRRRQRGLY